MGFFISIHCLSNKTKNIYFYHHFEPTIGSVDVLNSFRSHCVVMFFFVAQFHLSYVYHFLSNENDVEKVIKELNKNYSFLRHTKHTNCFDDYIFFSLIFKNNTHFLSTRELQIKSNLNNSDDSI